MASLDTKSVFEQLPDDACGQEIRRLRETLLGVERFSAGTRVATYVGEHHDKQLDKSHLDACIALLRDRASNPDCLLRFMERVDAELSADQIDTIIECLERFPYASATDGSHATFVASHLEGKLSRAQHDRLIALVVTFGESSDAGSYAETHLKGNDFVHDPSIHDPFIDLFCRDTVDGPEEAAKYPYERELTWAQHAKLIEAIIGQVRKRFVVSDLSDFLSNARDGLDSAHMDRILEVYEEHRASAEDFRRILEQGPTLRDDQTRRVTKLILRRDAVDEGRDPDLAAFDPDEVFV